MIAEPLLKYIDYCIIITRQEEEKYIMAVKIKQLEEKVKELEEKCGRLVSSNSN